MPVLISPFSEIIPIAPPYHPRAFFSQFHALKRACTDRGVKLMGDLPIYVAHDSADVWSHPALFKLDQGGRLLVQAGVPPDYFSATGQLWGNPIYDWDAMRAQRYDWWIRRMRSAFELFDLVRINRRDYSGWLEVSEGGESARTGIADRGQAASFYAFGNQVIGQHLNH